MTTETPPDFNIAYHKARKQYAFCSALLLAWELIGIDVKEAPLQNVNIILKSPQAVPYVLIALVAYSCFRFIIEWKQNHQERRNLRASKIDFYVAHGIAGLAIIVYAIQAITKIQIVNEPNATDSYGFGVFCYFCATMTVIAYQGIRTKTKIFKYWLVAIPGVLVTYFAIIIKILNSGVNGLDWVAAGIGIFLGVLTLTDRWKTFKEQMKNRSKSPS